MKNRVFVVALLLCVAMMVLAYPAQTQNKRIGTAAATELLIPIGARDLAMGGSTIANSRGVESIHWNPAGLGTLQRDAEGMFSSMSYLADITVAYGAVAANFGDFGVVGLSIKSLDFGDIPLTTNADPEARSGRLFSPTFVTVGLTYGRSLTDAISAGTNVKLVTESIDRVSSTGLAIDVGIQYNGLVGVSGLQLGVAVKNIGPQMKFDGPGLYRNATSSDGSRPEQKYKTEAASFELPSLVEIGLAYQRPIGDNMMYSVNGSFTNNNLYLDEYKVGGEYMVGIDDVKLFGRAGMGFVPKVENGDNIFGATLGFGITYAAGDLELTVDYAFRQVDFFDNNNVFSLKVGF